MVRAGILVPGGGLPVLIPFEVSRVLFRYRLAGAPLCGSLPLARGVFPHVATGV